ncbi:MAG: hypothetical protein DCC75_04430 [Proteobacteria bacterium]|nr:MAG: hypothetical protein DCC75_04430 [Pseudomonadota bacterium]
MTSTSYAAPHPDTGRERLGLALITGLRCIFLGLCLVGLDRILDFGTAAWVLALSLVAGVLLATYLAHSRARFAGLVVLMVIVYLGSSFLLQAMGIGAVIFSMDVLRPYTLGLHIDSCFIVLAVAAFSTWFFWRTNHAVIVEVILFALAVILLFSSHRGFRFDYPKVMNSWAWSLGISHLSMLVTLGAILLGTFLAYLGILSAPWKQRAGVAANTIRYNKGRGSKLIFSTFLMAAALYVYLISSAVYERFHALSQSRIANGVGQESAEKMSPLGFHSALGATNQPSALARLEGDYPSNPFSPMLYMREAALSKFDGHELVIAERRFDQDINNTSPDQPFVGQEDPHLISRTPLTQSFYLLSDHKTAFAIDYPISITQLKNPNPGRFKAAYRAYSMTPGFPLSELEGLPLGDARWDEGTRSHYLEIHHDPRYSELARRIVGGASSPLEEANAIVDFLNKNAIYTLSPGHSVKEEDDPVAPFLFGDLRGYCVHFAHATVYMLRALGIPARIATGYLTDLSQAKDGHILLRMSDRHAWAEVYFDQKGWIPFDTKPEQAESHAESPVDMKVLEELMAMIGPGEEVLPKDVAQGEANLEEKIEWPLPDTRQILAVLIIAILSLLLFKLYLLYGWILPGNAAYKLRHSYIALAARLHDLGIKRNLGETRAEFRERIRRDLGADILPISEVLTLHSYSHRSQQDLASQVHSSRSAGFEEWLKLTKLKRVFAWLNPSSIFSSLRGDRW